MIFKREKQKGFSLVEMLIYVSLLSVIFVAVVNMLIDITRNYRALKVSKDIDLSAFTLMERFASEIKAADDINVSQSALATTTNPVLSLDSHDTNGNATIIKFSVSKNLLHVSEGGVDKGALIASTTQITRLIFYSVAASTSQAVKIEMSLSSGTSTMYRKENFYTTAVLRGSYKNQ